MEFASEMVIRATREQLDVRELPIQLHRRAVTLKLSPFRDGWRHLRLIVVYNPTFLFLIPGAVMFAVGCLITLMVIVQVPFLGRDLYIHSLIVGCLLILLGVQAMAWPRPRVFGVLHQRQGSAIATARREFKLETDWCCVRPRWRPVSRCSQS